MFVEVAVVGDVVDEDCSCVIGWKGDADDEDKEEWVLVLLPPPDPFSNDDVAVDVGSIVTTRVLCVVTRTAPVPVSAPAAAAEMSFVAVGFGAVFTTPFPAPVVVLGIPSAANPPWPPPIPGSFAREDVALH